LASNYLTKNFIKFAKAKPNSMSDTLIKVDGLYKKFCQSLKRSMFYGTVDATKSMFGLPIENVDLRKKNSGLCRILNLSRFFIRIT